MFNDIDLRRAYAFCAWYARSNSRGYGLGVQWLPIEKRPYCEALLAFAMHTDTLADGPSAESGSRAIRFRKWCEVFAAAYSGKRDRQDDEWLLCLAFADTMKAWGFTKASVETYFRAQEAEIAFTHFATYTELAVHADELIGTTCAWANAIYGGTSPEAERRARQLAMASQLSDYLVDLRVDVADGRLYLPLEDLDRFGVSRHDLVLAASGGRATGPIKELMLFEARRALGFCDSGSGWELLVDASARDAAWLPGSIYRHQLEQIVRAGGDVFAMPPVRVEEMAERARVALARADSGAPCRSRPVAGGDRPSLPVHLGIILDGNRRWAQRRDLPAAVGHRQGGAVFRDLAAQLIARGIKYVSAYLFSTENWTREPQEVSELMILLTDLAGDATDRMHAANIRIRFLGRPEELSQQVRSAISRAERITESNDGGTLAICVNYGGLTEIADAFRRMVSAKVTPLQISPETIAEHLYAPDIPPVDLVLRAGGEQRLSNFMLWRAAYAELAFIPKLWPDVTMADFDLVLDNYDARVRRFGS